MLDLSVVDQIMMEIGGELNFLKDHTLSDVQLQQQLSTMVTDEVELHATSGDDMLSQSDDTDEKKFLQMWTHRLSCHPLPLQKIQQSGLPSTAWIHWHGSPPQGPPNI